MKRSLPFILGFIMSASAAQASSDIDFIQNLAAYPDKQERFKSLSEDLGGAVSYRSISPAEPLGITGIDIGVEVTRADMPNADDWAIVTSDSDSIDYLFLPRVHVHKGLPFGIDIGAFYTGASNTNLSLVGAEFKYAFIEGGVATPAVSVRGGYTKVSGIDQLDMDTKSLELSISKGFALLTPYAGIGNVWVTSDPKKEAALAGLEKEEVSLSKFFAGLNINFGLVNFDVEGDKTGDATNYSLKMGFRF